MAATTEVVVSDLRYVANEVVELTLEKDGPGPLPLWDPGAHIDLVLSGDLVRQYSLCGDPSDGSSYRIAVLRENASSGGSEYIHNYVRRGDRLQIKGPRNHFPLEPAESYLFIAGGIGVTPILPMVERIAAQKLPFRLVYGGRDKESMAFVDRLGPFESSVRFVPEDKEGKLDLEEALHETESNTHVYCCGPEPLICAVERICEHRSIDQLHIERFAAGDSKLHNAIETDSGSTKVLLRRSGIELVVRPGRTILETVLEAGVEVSYDCSEGICGSCEVRVIEGDIEHRDKVLTKRQRATNESMMICCSRAKDGAIILDL